MYVLSCNDYNKIYCTHLSISYKSVLSMSPAVLSFVTEEFKKTHFHYIKGTSSSKKKHICLNVERACIMPDECSNMLSKFLVFTNMFCELHTKT